MTRIPTHVQKAIETRLGAPIRYANGTFHPNKCPTCGMWTLYGLDALMIRLDPTPLTKPLEQAALLLGRWTYQLHGTPGHFEITARAAPERTIWPDAPEPGPECVVIPTHKCGHPYLAPPTQITQSTTDIPDYDNTNPPF